MSEPREFAPRANAPQALTPTQAAGLDALLLPPAWGTLDGWLALAEAEHPVAPAAAGLLA